MNFSGNTSKNSFLLASVAFLKSTNSVYGFKDTTYTNPPLLSIGGFDEFLL